MSTCFTAAPFAPMFTCVTAAPLTPMFTCLTEVPLVPMFVCLTAAPLEPPVLVCFEALTPMLWLAKVLGFLAAATFLALNTTSVPYCEPKRDCSQSSPMLFPPPILTCSDDLPLIKLAFMPRKEVISTPYMLPMCDGRLSFPATLSVSCLLCKLPLLEPMGFVVLFPLLRGSVGAARVRVSSIFLFNSISSFLLPLPQLSLST
mmetsp:Transcript_9176/g.16592  ORF Transcript_9176/g.16592 Transcript_9176/m.16592 type:complete len:203 (+) Transcript_9176:1434-2042(+)